jgi:hypothetical protein
MAATRAVRKVLEGWWIAFAVGQCDGGAAAGGCGRAPVGPPVGPVGVGVFVVKWALHVLW